MKTLADVKRRVRVGTRLLCVENTYRPSLNGTTREVVKVQTVGFAWVVVGDPKGERQTTRWEKAKFVRVEDTDTFEMKLWGDTSEDYVRLKFLDTSAP